MTVQELMETVDRMIAPPMTRGQALEVLELIGTEVESRIEGIKDDMRRAGQDWGDDQ